MRISKFTLRLFFSLAWIILLIGIGNLTWSLLHQPVRLPENVYPYLTSLSSDTVLLSHQEGGDSPNAWAAILAIRSSLPDDAAQSLLRQGQYPISFDTLLQNLPREEQDKIKENYRILIRYPYFEPGRFGFPCPTYVWYDDTYGADREGGSRKHEGTDLFAREGTPIYSVCEGTVERLGWNRLGGERVGVRGFDGNYYYYAHLQSISPDLQVGMNVNKGDYLGAMGHTGDAITTPDHLHFGIQLPNDEWINPFSFLKVWESYSS